MLCHCPDKPYEQSRRDNGDMSGECIIKCLREVMVEAPQ